MYIKKLIFFAIIFLWSASLFGAVPSIDSVSFNEKLNELTIVFDDSILVDPLYFSIGGLTLDDDNGGLNDDVTLTGGVIKTPSGMSNMITIYLLFEGNNGSYSIEEATGMVEYDTWGIVKSSLTEIESFENKDDLSLTVRNNSFLSADYEPNDAIEGIPVDYDTIHFIVDTSVVPNDTTYTENPKLLSASYSAGTNKLVLNFDSIIQWDSVNEDRIETTGPNAGRGSGVLEAGEDLNNNGVLDFEQNIDISERFIISDGVGSAMLTADAILTLVDSTSIEIKLLPDNAKFVENLNLDSLRVTFPMYTFVDTAYNSVMPVANKLITGYSDPNPLLPTTAEYTMSDNKLKVYFNKNIASGFYIVPKFAFQVADNDPISLQGSNGSPTISTNKITIELLGMDQQVIEAEMYALGETAVANSVKLLMEANAIRDQDGNYNVASEVDTVTIGYSEDVPMPTEVTYDANLNKLNILFNLRIQKTAETINLNGFSLLSDTVTINLSSETFGVTTGNKQLELYLKNADQALVENLPDTANIKLLIQAYSVIQSGTGNGNFEITADNNIMVNWVPDSTAPVAEYVRFNETSGNLEVRFTDAMNTELSDLSKVTYAGLTLTSTGPEMGHTPCWVFFEITDLSGLNNLPNKDSIYVEFEQGAFTSIRGAMNAAGDFNDLDTVISGNDTITVVTGYGRDFYLESKELTPTLDRIVPASIRKIGNHCTIYVADDQWVGYDSLFIGIREYNTNNDYVPTNYDEVEIVYNFFENETINGTDTLGGAYYRLNELFADNDSTVIPMLNIFMCDIRDEFAMDRTSGNANVSFWTGAFFNSNDQISAFQAAGEFNTNEMNLIYLDTWPQLYSETDINNFTIFKVSDQPNIVWKTFSVADGNPVTFDNSIVNAYTKLLSYKIDPWESAWMIEGLSSLAENIITGDATFYGGGAPALFSSNALKNLDGGMRYKKDYWNAYVFMLYLYQKFGGDEFVKTLALLPLVDTPSIDSALVMLENQGVTDSTAQAHLDLYIDQLGYSTRDIYAFYGMACLVDTSNMAYATSVDSIAIYGTMFPDNYMFQIDGVDFRGKMTGKGATGMKWDSVKDPPPYYLTQETWSFNYYYSGYGTGVVNPLLNDNSIINILLPFDEIDCFHVLFKNSFVDFNQPNYYHQYHAYNPDSPTISFPMSPDSLWTPGLELSDYKCMTIVGVHQGQIKVTMDQAAPDYYLSVVQSEMIASRFDVFLIASGGVWGDGAIGADLPQVRYTLDNNQNSVLMSPNYLVNSPGDTAGINFYSCYLDLVSDGNYNISAFFTSLGGDPVYTTPGSYIVDSYEPGQNSVISLDGSEIVLDGGSFDQPFSYLYTTIPYNADEGAENAYLYTNNYYAAPPIIGREKIGPAYNLDYSAELDEPASISLPYSQYIGNHSPQELGIYLYENGSWVYIGGKIETSDQTIRVRSKHLGLMQIQAGPHGDIPAGWEVPDRYALKQNYPNPFNPVTQIEYQLKQAGLTSLKIYNVLGQEVAELVNEFQNTGFYTVQWDGLTNNGVPAASGIYLYRLDSGDYCKSMKMVMLK